MASWNYLPLLFMCLWINGAVSQPGGPAAGPAAGTTTTASNPTPAYTLDDIFGNKFVAFSARATNNPVLTGGQVLVFDEVITNEGGAYNESTGEFTCPANGLYMFHVQIESSKGHHANVYLKRNDTNLMRIVAWPDDDFHAGGGSIIASCTTGQTIYVAGYGRMGCCLTNVFSGYSLKLT